MRYCLIADCAARGGVLYGQFPAEEDRRVLLASHELGLSGAPIALMYLARSLRRLGWQPVLISPAEGPPLIVCGFVMVAAMQSFFAGQLLQNAYGNTAQFSFGASWK